MADGLDAEEVVDLALVPGGGGHERREGRIARLCPGRDGLPSSPAFRSGPPGPAAPWTRRRGRWPQVRRSDLRLGSVRPPTPPSWSGSTGVPIVAVVHYPSPELVGGAGEQVGQLAGRMDAEDGQGHQTDDHGGHDPHARLAPDRRLRAMAVSMVWDANQVSPSVARVTQHDEHGGDGVAGVAEAARRR